MTSDDARRASAVLHRDLRYKPPVAVAGDGAYIFDAQGGAIWTPAAERRCPAWAIHPRIVEAVREPDRKAGYTHTSFFTNGPSEELAKS